ncbi:hypothetical protein CI105_06470 [Candidatus Izimaplasma bacterium ZiA1]|uniref:hypothetical protein n=1 Tax=Candidatus Izimoplasma sp. ZiA1 TaxID=2024899 RepID=UPI000BAA3771|nr:hypothetical protein CI105_06470 [Candidatus Izimaplasma bacterium ZiA1]
MKKTIFFIILLFVAIPRVNTYAATNQYEYVFESYQINTEPFYENNKRGYTITRTGNQNYSKTVINSKINYTINGIINHKNNTIIYGYCVNDDTDTFYDVFYTVFDASGNIINDYTNDFNKQEEIIKFYTLGNDVFFYFNQASLDYEPITESFYVVKLDNQYGVDDYIKIEGVVESSDNDEYLIKFNFEHLGNYDLGVTKNLKIIDETYTIDLNNRSNFEDVKILVLNPVTLNNEVIYDSILIDYPGHYEIMINNATHTFDVEALIEGVIANSIVKEPIIVTYNKGQVFLNDDLYLSGTIIEEPGFYQLIVNGINDYQKIIEFTIKPEVNGIINNTVYKEPITLDFNGEGYLNNQFIESGFYVENEGEYLLKIKGVNGYLENYYFQIISEENQTSIMDIITKYDIYVLGTVVLIGIVILKKTKTK